MNTEIEIGQKIVIPAACIEFFEGGNTVWIHGDGGTIIRIKCSGKIISDSCNTSPVTHVDLVVEGNVHFCVSKDAQIG